GAFFAALARLALSPLSGTGGGDWAGGASEGFVWTFGPAAGADAAPADWLAGRLGAVFRWMISRISSSFSFSPLLARWTPCWLRLMASASTLQPFWMKLV